VFVSVFEGGGVSWSRDGTRLTYTKDPQTGVYVYDFRDSTETQLTRHGHYPHWSPVEDLIVFVSQETGSSDIWTVDPASGQQHQLTEHAWDNEYASWSSDGRKIVFRGLSDIFIMDVDGGNLLNISQHPGNDSQPSWSPVPVED